MEARMDAGSKKYIINDVVEIIANENYRYRYVVKILSNMISNELIVSAASYTNSRLLMSQDNSYYYDVLTMIDTTNKKQALKTMRRNKFVINNALAQLDGDIKNKNKKVLMAITRARKIKTFETKK